MAPTIEFWFELASTYSYVGAERIEAVARPAGVEVVWRPFLLGPVFTAQHATATVCRGCLAKWHHIERGRELTAEERRYVVEVIERWLRQYLPIDRR